MPGWLVILVSFRESLKLNLEVMLIKDNDPYIQKSLGHLMFNFKELLCFL